MKYNENPNKFFYWLFPVVCVILLVFVLVGNCNAQNTIVIDSIANHMIAKGQILDTLEFDDTKLINIYLDMENVVNLDTWSLKDIEKAYYARLDFFDILTQINSNHYNLTINHYKVIIYCSIFEMDILERLNELDGKRN